MLNNSPLISIIFPTFNNFEGFTCTIRDFQSQLFFDFEMIIIDDFSDNYINESKKKFIKDLNDSRFNYYSNENKMGFALTINKGFELTKGHYITWISDNNEYYSNYLSILYDPYYEFTYSSWITNENKTINKKYDDVNDLLNHFIGLGSFMWKRSLIEKIGKYDHILKGCDDFDYLIRTFLLTEKIKYDNNVTMKCIHHEFLKSNDDIDNIILMEDNMVQIYQLLIENQKDLDIYYSDAFDLPFNDYHLSILLSDNIGYDFERNIYFIPKEFETLLTNFPTNKKFYDFNDLTANANSLSNNIEKKISIVMAYYNRKEQLITTFDTIKLSSYSNFEVIIVDDTSNDENRLEDIIDNYNFTIKLIRIEPINKTWINSCIPYNIGIQNAIGDIIILQNPEVCHIGDILTYVNKYMKEDQYISFSCYALPDFFYNDKLKTIVKNKGDRNEIMNLINEIDYSKFVFDWKYYIDQYEDTRQIQNEKEAKNHWNEIGNLERRKCNKHGIYATRECIMWNGWYIHLKYNPRPLHFLSATYSKNIEQIQGFNEILKDGLWFEDDDILERMKEITNVIIIPETNVFAIHQYHTEGSSSHTNDNKIYLINKNSKLRSNGIFDYGFSKGVNYVVCENKIKKPYNEFKN